MIQAILPLSRGLRMPMCEKLQSMERLCGTQHSFLNTKHRACISLFTAVKIDGVGMGGGEMGVGLS